MSIKVTASSKSDYRSILSADALGFIAELQRLYNPSRLTLLKARETRQTAFDRGEFPNFLAETKQIREMNWSIAPIPNALGDRRVEITGPVERKMIINALNSQALAFMADFEDSSSPTWDNMVQGQINLRDAINREIDYLDVNSGKHYALNDKTATLIVRPRGWHLDEQHLYVDGQAMSASIFDFALYFFHNAKQLSDNGSGPYFYLPKLESHKEARLWNDIFITAQEMLSIDSGTIKATVLIETLPAAFEMDEILYELREHIVGLNCGRWDYIFSFIKKFRNNPACVLPDRTDVTMTSHFLKSYVDLLIQTCHKRGAYAMGGMAAQIPIKSDTQANQAALDKVMADKLREARAGHDGTWVAHPGLIPTALNAFNQSMHGSHNQLEQKRRDVKVTAIDLLQIPNGKITEQGFINNINIGIQYLAAWLNGNGCVPIYHLMEDAATAEICRVQLWQWLHHQVTLDTGQQVTATLFDDYLNKALQQIKQDVGMPLFATPIYQSAIKLFTEMIKKKEFDEFLTLPAYELLINQEAIKHE